MKNAPHLIAGLAALALVLPSCGLLKRKPTPDDSKAKWWAEVQAGRQQLGYIVGVKPNLGFVTIRTPFASLVKEEAQLVSLSAGGQTGRLLLSPEKNRIFLAADIEEGDPQVRDAVFFASTQNPKKVTAAQETAQAADLPPLGKPSDEREDAPPPPLPDSGNEAMPAVDLPPLPE